MRKSTLLIIGILAVLMLLPPSVAQSQNYDKLSQAIAKLDSTLKVFLEAQKAQQKPVAQLADAEGLAATPARPLGDTPGAIEVASSLETVVSQLQDVVTDAKEAQKNQPKNPAATGYGKITFTGLIHQQYYSKEGTQRSSTFDTRYMLFGAAGTLNRWARVNFLGNFAKSPTLLDAYATLTPNKYWAIDFGQYKPPFGADPLKPTSAMPFINLFKGISLGTGRDVGMDISLNYEWLTGNAVKITGGLFNGAGPNTSDANTDKNFIGRAEIKLAKMFTVSPELLSGKTNDPDSTKQNIDAWGTALNWTWKNEVVEGEYIHNKTGSTEKQGWYVWGGHTFATGLQFVPEIQVLGRYEKLDPNMNLEHDGSDRITLGTNLFIDKKYTKLQVNYQINGEEGTSLDNNEWLMNLQLAF